MALRTSVSVGVGILGIGLMGGVLFAMGLIPVHAAGTTYHVSTNGSDSISCSAAQSASTPKRTIQAGVNCATAPGDTVIVHAGAYVEQVTNWNSGASGYPITLKANPGEIVTWRSNDTRTNSHIGPITIADKSYIRIEGFRFDSSVTDNTIRVYNSHLFDGNSTPRANFPMVGIEIINNTCVNNGNNAKNNGCTTGSSITISLNGLGNESNPGTTTSKVQGNSFTGNYGQDIVLSASNDVLVESNVSTGLKGSQDINNAQGYMARSIFICCHGPYNGFIYESSRNVVQRNTITAITCQSYMNLSH